MGAAALVDPSELGFYEVKLLVSVVLSAFFAW